MEVETLEQETRAVVIRIRGAVDQKCSFRDLELRKLYSRGVRGHFERMNCKLSVFLKPNLLYSRYLAGLIPCWAMSYQGGRSH